MPLPTTPPWIDAPRNLAWRVLDHLLGFMFGVGARLRRSRPTHTRGWTYAATFTGGTGRRRTGVPLLDERRTRDAVVRISRGVGLRRGLPDVAGFAVRVHDAFGAGRDLDLLLSSTGRPPVLRHVLRPTRRTATFVSSLFQYTVGGRVRFLAVSPVGGAADGVAPAALRLLVASRWGRWHEAGRVHLGERLPVDAARQLRFNVVTRSDPALHPSGWIQALRDRSYRAPQRTAPDRWRADDAVQHPERVLQRSTP